MNSEKPLHFRLQTDTFQIDAVLFIPQLDGVAYLVDFQGSPKGINYEILDAWVSECEGIFFEYNDEFEEDEGYIQELLLELILDNIKAALNTDSE